MDEMTKAARYYDQRYDIVFDRIYQRSEKLELGDRSIRRCRFCGNSPTVVTFGKVAHAIPEALGNRGLTSAYECDTCNELFGGGIESDLGEWSKPIRTFSRIAGKNGVPTLKQSSQGGWRIQFADGRLNITDYEDNPVHEVDEANKRVIITLKRGSFTPVAVFKAFVKIGLTLLPEPELAPFTEALAWVRETDHAKSWIRAAPIIYTFLNGPMPNDRITALVLRRKPSVVDVPYAFLILGFGNEVFQVILPAPAEDAVLKGQNFSVVPFPTPGGPDPARYGRAVPKAIDMTGVNVVRGETTTIVLRFEESVRIEPASGDPALP